MLQRRGAMMDPCGTPFLRRRNLLRLPLAVVRVKLRLPKSSMIKRIMRLSSSNRSNLQVQAALTAVTVWFIIVYCFFTAGSAKFLQLSFVIFVGEELAVFWFEKGECEKNFENHCARRF